MFCVNQGFIFLRIAKCRPDKKPPASSRGRWFVFLDYRLVSTSLTDMSYSSCGRLLHPAAAGGL